MLLHEDLKQHLKAIWALQEPTEPFRSIKIPTIFFAGSYALFTGLSLIHWTLTKEAVTKVLHPRAPRPELGHLCYPTNCASADSNHLVGVCGG